MFDLMQHSNLDQSISLAGAVQRELVATAGRKNLGVKQAPFWVLVKTGMPAILVELDFICNPDEEAFMWSDEGSDKLARAIYNGIKSTATAKAPQRRRNKGSSLNPTLVRSRQTRRGRLPGRSDLLPKPSRRQDRLNTECSSLLRAASSRQATGGSRD